MASEKIDAECRATVETIRLRRHNFPSGEESDSASASHAVGALPPPAAADGTDEARNQKVLTMLPLLHSIAKRMRVHLPSHVEMDDLVGAGAIGLIDAVQKFDARKNVKLESYAQHRIRGAIIDSLRAMDCASRDQRKKSKKTEAAFRALEGKLGRAASDEEFARAQGITLSTWYRTIRELQALGLKWLRPTESSGQQHLTEETLTSHDGNSQFDLCYLREKREILNRALASLPCRERLILLLYYIRQLTMKQIGEQLDVNESRVSQLHSAALLRMRTTVMTLLRAPRHSAVAAGGQQELRAA